MPRPSKYNPKFNEQVYHFALLGADENQIADFFDVSKATITNWKKSEPEFLASLKRGKDEADAQVVKSLYKRAIGYSYKETKVTYITKGDKKVETERVETEKQQVPDTTAQIFWLKNRQPAKWRDKQEIDHSGITFDVKVK